MTPTPPLSTAVADLDLPRTGKMHELKTDPAVFAAVLSGAKTHEIRANDRGFAVGDALWLRETGSTGEAMRAGAPLEYTGREITRIVSHVLTGYGLQDGWCILSLAAPASDIAAAPEQQQDHVAPPFAAPASQHATGFRGTISAGEYNRDTGMMYVTVKVPFKGLPEELLTINGPAMIATVSESAASGFREGRNAQNEGRCAECGLDCKPGQCIYESPEVPVSPPDGAMPAQKRASAINCGPGIAAEQPVPRLANMNTVAAREAKRIDTMHKGVVGVFAAIKAEHLAAQPAEGSAQVAKAEQKMTHFRGCGGKWNRLPESADPDAYRAQGYEVGYMHSPSSEIAAPERSDTPADPGALLTDDKRSAIREAVRKAFPDYAHSDRMMDQLIWNTEQACVAAASKALAAAPAGLEQTMMEKRIEVIPEYEGEWRAYVYLDSEEPQSTAAGPTPSVAVERALARIDGDKQGAQGEKA